MDEHRLQEWLNIGLEFTRDTDKALTELVDNSRKADQRAEKLARVHADGWRQVATAIEDGLREIASAIRASSR